MTPLEFCTPLREIKVALKGKTSEWGVLDDGSEIVVVRKDLWEELGFDVNKERLMMMQAANGSRERMEGCAEFLEVTVGDVRTWVHAFVVPHAPFKLLLGRPWQKSVLLRKDEFEDGRVDVTIHDPCNWNKTQVIPTRAR
ncbi:hypothetical protein BYT27DRAFT_7103566, partial [Phlegmacium glaucopus]